MSLRLWDLAKRAPILLFAVLLSACASYQSKVDNARRDFASDPSKAAAQLEPLAKEDGKDQLIYMLDYATALQLAGRNKESAKAFSQAEVIADQKDYHSVSKIASSLVLSEEMVQYKGDDFEKVLINGMNAINYLALGEVDDALVEVRRVNEKLTKLKQDGKKEFNQSPFAYYLGALIWEADRKYDDAYISYKDAYGVAPFYQPLHEDLVRSSTGDTVGPLAREERPERDPLRQRGVLVDRDVGVVDDHVPERQPNVQPDQVGHEPRRRRDDVLGLRPEQHALDALHVLLRRVQRHGGLS